MVCWTIGPRASEDGEFEEDDPGEPSLAAPERHPNTYGYGVTLSGNQLRWADGANSLGQDDCEVENEHGGDINDEPQHDDADDEPTLGWTESGQHGEVERDGELEPSLGAPELTIRSYPVCLDREGAGIWNLVFLDATGQENWAGGSTDDRERDSDFEPSSERALGGQGA